LLLRENLDLKAFIRSESDKLIPRWNGNMPDSGSNEFDNDDLSNNDENWEDDL